ncbi:MAG: MinD/ParA family protein [Verrucomicrobia bacterium]|nr:MinD/ParA family protein [Verrucomicrobiota bacterium]
MSTELIKILIADSDGHTRDVLCSYLAGDPNYQIVGRAVNGDECLTLAHLKQPDVVILSSTLKPTPAIEVCEQLILQTPHVATLMVLPQGFEENLFRRMMTAGVSEFLIGALEKERTLDAIRSAVDKAARHRRVQESKESRLCHKVITVVGPRGGCGCTTLAVNLCCAIARSPIPCDLRPVALLDTRLNGSDAANLLDLEPRRTLAEVAANVSVVDHYVLDSLAATHICGAALLTAAIASTARGDPLPRSIMTSTLALLRQQFAFTVLDLVETSSEAAQAALDYSDTVVLTVAVDVLRLRAARLLLIEWLAGNLPRQKIRVVLNDIDPESDHIETARAEHILEFPVTARLPFDGRAVPAAINLGQPFVLTHPDKPLSRAIRQLAGKLGAQVPEPPRSGLFGLFGRNGNGGRHAGICACQRGVAAAGEITGANKPIRQEDSK